MSTKCIEHDTTVPIYGDHFFVNFLFPNRKDTQLHSSTKVIMYGLRFLHNNYHVNYKKAF